MSSKLNQELIEVYETSLQSDFNLGAVLEKYPNEDISDFLEYIGRTKNTHRVYFLSLLAEFNSRCIDPLKEFLDSENAEEIAWAVSGLLKTNYRKKLLESLEEIIEKILKSNGEAHVEIILEELQELEFSQVLISRIALRAISYLEENTREYKVIKSYIRSCDVKK